MKIEETDSHEMRVTYETKNKHYRGFWIPGRGFRLWGESETLPAKTKRDLVTVLVALPSNI